MLSPLRTVALLAFASLMLSPQLGHAAEAYAVTVEH